MIIYKVCNSFKYAMQICVANNFAPVKLLWQFKFNIEIVSQQTDSSQQLRLTTLSLTRVYNTPLNLTNETQL